MPEQKITSVVELSKYKLGDKLYWVVLRPKTIIKKPTEKWHVEPHPKTIFERGYAKGLWPSGRKLPRVIGDDFDSLMDLLCSVPSVEQFDIRQIFRSRDTGEFQYANADNEWLPESCLFETEKGAQLEKKRILTMVAAWAKKHGNNL